MYIHIDKANSASKCKRSTSADDSKNFSFLTFVLAKCGEHFMKFDKAKHLVIST